MPCNAGDIAGCRTGVFGVGIDRRLDPRFGEPLNGNDGDGNDVSFALSLLIVFTVFTCTKLVFLTGLTECNMMY